MIKKLGKKIVTFALSLTVAATVFVGASVSVFAYTQTTGKVTSDNVKVRSSASTTASQVSSLKKGDNVDIVDESTDASGYVWYKIFVNKSEYGYVRSDLVTKSGDSAPKTATSTGSNTQTENKSQAQDLPATTVTATEQRTASVTSESVNVRGGAGTGYDSVGKVTKGETVTITGEATDKDGKTWYQVTFGSNGKTGFVRSDLVAVSEAAPAEGGEAAPAEGGEGENTEAAEGGETEGGETEQPAATASDVGDGTYSLVYTADEEGTNTWYLYDNVEGYRVKVKKLIEAAQSTEAVNKLVSTNKKYKTIVVILALVAAALAVAVVLLLLKLRDAMYYEDEEEEEFDQYDTRKRPSREQEPEEERPARRRERTVRPEEDESFASSRVAERRAAKEEREDRPARRQASEGGSFRRNSEERTVRPERNPEDRPSRRAPEPERPSRNAAPKRKTRNFIGDDDDFEFEFLDLDDDK
ncbi:SH3 domain-containing protein [Butyrivibrio sp. MC2021]|uniref:SH3 domain-containing protein n=1 Tax=Butyrivibrio sp. MC2021 TaxID=1408306 RepID=UPI00047D2E42|nr:SH3 domain-containing protein [Butyrivibrio sp. MC2021]